MHSINKVCLLKPHGVRELTGVRCKALTSMHPRSKNSRKKSVVMKAELEQLNLTG